MFRLSWDEHNALRSQNVILGSVGALEFGPRLQPWENRHHTESPSGALEHHRRISFEDEFVSLLKKNEMEFDERYLWG